jgi:hypothetical protein
MALVGYVVGLSYFEASEISERQAAEAVDHYLKKLAGSDEGSSPLEERRELINLKNQVAVLNTDFEGFNSVDRVVGVANLVIIALTLFVAIAVPLWGVQRLDETLKKLGKEIASQIAERTSTLIANASATTLLQLQFDQDSGWQRRTDIDHKIDKSMIANGELALKHAKKIEELLKDTDSPVKIDLAGFQTFKVIEMTNNLLFSLGLLDSEGLDEPRAGEIERLRREKAPLAEKLLREITKVSEDDVNYLLTEIRAETNFFDLWIEDEKPAEIRKRYATIRLKMKKADSLLTPVELSSQPLISNSSLKFCRKKLDQKATAAGLDTNDRSGNNLSRIGHMVHSLINNIMGGRRQG